MSKNKNKKILLSTLIVVLVAIAVFTFIRSNPSIFSSSETIKFHEFTIKGVPKGWNLLGKDGLDIGWLYKKNNSSLGLKIGKNVSERMFSNKAYENILIGQYLKLNPKNKLIDIYTQEMWGASFNFIKIKFYNSNYGWTQLIVFFKRVNKKSYLGAISIPYKEENINTHSLPEYIEQMLHCISFNLKEPTEKLGRKISGKECVQKNIKRNHYYEMTPEQIEAFKADLGKIKLGDSSKKVIQILGMPDTGGEWSNKPEYNLKTVTLTFRYYIRFDKNAELNNEDGYYVDLFFNSQKKLLGVTTNDRRLKGVDVK